MNDGGKAFPQSGVWDGSRDQVNPCDSYFDAGGMSLRDYAVIKFISAQISWEGMEGTDASFNVKMANEYADAMLAEREKQ